MRICRFWGIRLHFKHELTHMDDDFRISGEAGRLSPAHASDHFRKKSGGDIGASSTENH